MNGKQSNSAAKSVPPQCNQIAFIGVDWSPIVKLLEIHVISRQSRDAVVDCWLVSYPLGYITVSAWMRVSDCGDMHLRGIACSRSSRAGPFF